MRNSVLILNKDVSTAVYGNIWTSLFVGITVKWLHSYRFTSRKILLFRIRALNALASVSSLSSLPIHPRLSFIKLIWQFTENWKSRNRIWFMFQLQNVRSSSSAKSDNAAKSSIHFDLIFFPCHSPSSSESTISQKNCLLLHLNFRIPEL